MSGIEPKIPFFWDKNNCRPASFLLCLALIYKLLANEDAIEQSKAWFHSCYKANSESDA